MLFYSIILFLVFIVYKIISYLPIFYFWKEKNVCHVSLLSVLKNLIFMRKSWTEMIREDCQRFRDKRYFGSYLTIFPVLFVTDLDLIKQILIRDFDHFTDRMDLLNSRSDPLFKRNLLAARGKEWKELRTTISPAFSSAKMKTMFALIAENARRFVDYFEAMDQELVEVDMKETFKKYTNDVIASCAFGADCDSLNDTENELFLAGKAICKTTPFKSYRGLIITIFPSLNKYLKLCTFPTELTQFFRTAITRTIRSREEKGIYRPDLLHQLIEAKKGKLHHEASPQAEVIGFATVTESKDMNYKTNLEITDDVITAQAIIFYMAAFETTSTVLTFLSMELASHPDVQRRLIEEIDKHLSPSETITFEKVTQMTYLDQVVTEALRKWSSPVVLFRKCTKEYTIEPKLKGEVPLTLKRGSLVLIPIDGTHTNPKYFENPGDFIPERFSDDRKNEIIPGSLIPFGGGPRNCIGSRFALLEIKCLVATILRKFEIQATDKTDLPVKLGKTFILSVDGNLILALKRRTRR